METPSAAADGEPGEEDQPVHYSTGRLTAAQAAAVNAWRARLLEAGGDRRASCSDAIAAAVADILHRDPPAPMALARYAIASAQARREADQGRRSQDEAPSYPPSSWYLPAELAAQAEQLRAEARAAVNAIREQVADEARRRYPRGGPVRAQHILMALAAHGLPLAAPQVPRGAIARLAIDRWTGRDPAQVAADAAAYAEQAHQQPHRARRDMRTLAR